MAVFIAIMSVLLPSQRKWDKVAHLTLIGHLSPPLLITVCACGRDLIPDQCQRETPPREAGSGEDVVEKEL